MELSSFKKIDIDTFSNIYSIEMDSFTKLEVYRIVDIVKSLIDTNQVYFNYTLYKLNHVSDSTIILNFGTGKRYARPRIRISKSIDEWYYVDVDIPSNDYIDYLDCYYRCDQMSGLEDCLEYILKEYNKYRVGEYVKEMKYLESYNSFHISDNISNFEKISESIDHSYYQGFPYGTIDDILFDGFMDITDKALSLTDSDIKFVESEVKRIIGDSKIPLYFRTKKRSELGGIGDDIVRISIYFNSDDICLSVYHVDDDWFYVNSMGWKHVENWYDFKCDQREGLVKLIEDCYRENYSDYDFTTWYKVDIDEVLGVDFYQFKHSDEEAITMIDKYIGIDNNIGDEFDILNKIGWVGLGKLDFVKKNNYGYTYITSNNPHHINNEDMDIVENEDGQVSYELTGIVVESFFRIYKFSGGYLVEDIEIKKDRSWIFSNFYKCKDISGVRKAIQFVIRKTNS